MLSNNEPPSVFYFAPVHFANKTFGYSVLQRDLSESRKLNLVYRNWLRLVNNSLEMMRARNRYIVLSTHDEMTGLLNRRGFYDELEKAAHNTETSKMDVVILSIDLDGLKKINDTYGHSESLLDEPYLRLAEAMRYVPDSAETNLLPLLLLQRTVLIAGLILL